MSLFRRDISLGSVACTLFAIASSVIATVFLANWGTWYKMAGYEIIVLGPLALVVYSLGVIFAIVGMLSGERSPIIFMGLVLNSLPLLWMIACLVFVFVT